MLFAAGYFFCAKDQIPEIANTLQPGEKIGSLKKFETDEIPEVFIVEDDEGVKKIVQKVITDGYVNKIVLLVTIAVNSEEVLEVEILQHQESEDYGGYLTEDWFLQRFIGKKAGQNLTLVKMSAKSSDQIVAITGATKTSAAVLRGVNLALQNCASIKGGLE